jgi:hypothetical protein
MRRKLVFRVTCALGLGCAILLLLTPTARIVVIGLLRGEKFYRARPTSYWRCQILERPFPYSEGNIVSFDFDRPVPASRLDEVKKSLGLKYKVTPYRYPLRENDPSALPVLIDLLHDDEPTVRMYAVESLGDLGPRAAVAIPDLKGLLNDNDHGGFGITVAQRAGEALKRIEGGEQN